MYSVLFLELKIATRKFMAKIQISDDEYSDDNEVLTDLMETEVSSAAHTPFAHPMYFI